VNISQADTTAKVTVLVNTVAALLVGTPSAFTLREDASKHDNAVVTFIIGLAIVTLVHVPNAAGANATQSNHIRTSSSVMYTSSALVLMYDVDSYSCYTQKKD
jgi:hypothetical protein